MATSKLKKDTFRNPLVTASFISGHYSFVFWQQELKEKETSASNCSEGFL